MSTRFREAGIPGAVRRSSGLWYGLATKVSYITIAPPCRPSLHDPFARFVSSTFASSIKCFPGHEMGSQLPSEVVGPAGGVLFYSFVCLTAGLFLLFLVCAHNEWMSYVAMLSALMCLGAVSSITQQIHTILWWRDIKAEQHANLVENVGNPELNITGASTGMDLVLFYIQYYTYTAESMLIFFWAVELAYSVFQMQKFKLHHKKGGMIAKGTSLILPAVLMCVLRTKAAQQNVVIYMFLSNFVMVISMTGAFLLLAILIKYIHAKKALVSWKVRYGQPSKGTAPSLTSSYPVARNRQTIYDNWLVVRFSIAFVALGLFQLVVILFQLRSVSSNKKENIPEEPDLSISKAKGDFALFVPGISAPLLLYVVFGTTRTFRDYTVKLFTPRRLLDKLFGSPANRDAQRTPGPPPVPPKDEEYHDPPASSHRPQYQPPQSPPESPEPPSKKSPQGEHRIQILQRPKQQSRPQTREKQYMQGEGTSWYGARPSDLESGFDDDFVPAPVRSNSHGTNITLRRLETASGKSRSSGSQRVVSHEAHDDDEWPMLIPISPLPTALTPRPRTRSDPRI